MLLKTAILCIPIIFLNLTFSKKTSYSKRKNTVLFFLLAISLSIISFHIDPLLNWDLTSHFRLMNDIRRSGFSFFDFIFFNKSGIGNYPTLISFNLIRYIICRLTINNHWLPSICVFLDYLIVAYIMVDWYHTSHLGEKLGILAPLLCFAFLPMIHAFSGMRNALACALAGLAIYKYLYKRCSFFFFLILIFIGATIHQVVLFAIPFVFLARFNIGKKGFIVVFIISLSLNRIAEYASRSTIPYISIIARRYISYSSESQFWGTRYALWSTLVLIISFIGLYLFLEKPFKKILWNENQKHLYMFLMYYMCFILGNIGNYDLVLRPAYMLGFFAPVLASLLDNKIVWSYIHGQIIQLVGKCLCILLCLLTLYIYVWPLVEVLLKR